MDLNIKGIIHLDFRDFKTVDELLDYIKKPENFNVLGDIRYDMEDFEIDLCLDYKKAYQNVDEIWVVDNFLVAKRDKGDDEIEINPEFSRFLLEKSVNYFKQKENIKKSKEFTENLSVDSILDRISQVGFENITESEKKFLDENG
jgi:hypothetical protein